MFRAGLVFFIAMTLIASVIATVVFAATQPPPPKFQIIKIDLWIMWMAFAVISGVVAFVATGLMMLAVWRKLGPPLVLGLIATIVAASAPGLYNYFDIALSTNEFKQAGTGRAITEYLVGMAVIVPAYLLTFLLCFRAPLMAPLLAPGSAAKSTASP